MKSCTFFGHSEFYENIEDELKSVVYDLIENKGVVNFYVGTHGKFDMLTKKILAEAKSKYNHLSCYMVLAYLNKDAASDSKIETLFPEGIEGVPKRYAIVFRNGWMIDRSDFVVTYVKYETGGAAKFKTIAEKKGKTVINIEKQTNRR